MPKAKRNASLNRVARRRGVALENLPSQETRKKNESGGGVSNDKKFEKATPSVDQKKLIVDKSNAVQEGIQKNTANKDDSINQPDIPPKQQLSRGQRKRLAKREQFLKKEKMILSSLMLQRQEEQKKRIDGLDAIKQALMDTSFNGRNQSSISIKPPTQHVSTNKAKRKLVAKEVEHMNLILQHPAFKNNPFETMQEHLRNTLAEERKQQEILSRKRSEEEKQENEAKKSIKKKSQKKKYKPRRTR